MFWCYCYTIIREPINLSSLKLQLLKQSIKIHRCVVNTVVVWLHILGPYWCLCVALFSSSYCQIAQPCWWCNCNTETCRNCFNVNFNIFFKTTHQCISWWINKTLMYVVMQMYSNVPYTSHKHVETQELHHVYL